MRGNAWAQLESYESHDLVGRFFEEAYGRDLSAGKAKELTSYLAQAREYFRAADQAADLVRPLLLYYGVLALSRWLILMRMPGLRETALEKSHGLDAADWATTIGDRGIAAFVDTKTRVTRGTFSQLLEAIEGSETFWLLDIGVPVGSTRWTQIVTPTPPLGLLLTPRDVLARIPELSGLFVETFMGDPSCREIRILNAVDSDGTGALLKRHFGEDRDWVEARFSLPEDAVVEQDVEPGSTDFLYYWELTFPSTPLKDAGPYFPPLAPVGTSTYVREPLPSGGWLPSIAFLFAISYMMGMLVRYYPTLWLSFLNREKGDAARPVLRASSDLVAHAFPALVHEYVVSVLSRPFAPKFRAVGVAAERR